MTRFVSVVALAACATAAPAPTAVPKNLEPPADQKLVLRLNARGTQNYTCNEKGTWAFTGPEANLTDTAGAQVGRGAHAGRHLVVGSLLSLRTACHHDRVAHRVRVRAGSERRSGAARNPRLRARSAR